MRLTTNAFDANGPIPKKHSGEGQDVSPSLAWSDVPGKAVELALVCDDPDAPRAEPFVHWVLWGIPTSLTGLAEGSDGHGKTGRNDFGRTGWGGPMPPQGHGTHHYHFRLFALDEELSLPEGATKAQLEAAMKGHVLESAELIGTYERR